MNLAARSSQHATHYHYYTLSAYTSLTSAPDPTQPTNRPTSWPDCTQSPPQFVTTPDGQIQKRFERRCARRIRRCVRACRPAQRQRRANPASANDERTARCSSMRAPCPTCFPAAAAAASAAQQFAVTRPPNAV